jgi:hypothetical protein
MKSVRARNVLSKILHEIAEKKRKFMFYRGNTELTIMFMQTNAYKKKNLIRTYAIKIMALIIITASI